MTTALERLTTGYYNSSPYDAATNPGGFGAGGHVVNFPLALADVATVAAVTNTAVLDAAQVSADKSSVTTMLGQVQALAQPVIDGLATYGMPARVQITNLNTLTKSGWFYSTTTATGRPGGETDGFVYAISDGAADNGAQIFTSKTTGKTYTRYRTGGTWQSWVELTTAATVTDTAFGAENTIASAATTNIGAAGSRMVEVTGTTTITSLGASGSTTNPHYLVRFAGALTLTHHATNLILPGGKNIATAAGDYALFQCVGSGQWRCVGYFRSSGQALYATGYGVETSIASAATVDLGAASALLVAITGTTTITGLGSSAGTARPVYRVRFTGALTLTHNGTSLILPGSANIATAAGDTAVFQYLGSGNWRCLAYHRADGKVLPAALADTTTTKAGTNTAQAVTPSGLAATVQSAAMVYAADTNGSADVLEAAITPAPAGLVEGMSVLVKVNGENTGSATLNLNSLGAVTIKREGNSLRAGDLKDGQIYRFTYDGSFWQLENGGDTVIRSSTYATISGGFITSGASTPYFTLSRTGNGAYTLSLANAAASISSWGASFFVGNSDGNLNLSANEKSKTTGALTFQVRNGGNSLSDPTSIDVTVWIKP